MAGYLSFINVIHKQSTRKHRNGNMGTNWIKTVNQSNDRTNKNVATSVEIHSQILILYLQVVLMQSFTNAVCPYQILKIIRYPIVVTNWHILGKSA